MRDRKCVREFVYVRERDSVRKKLVERERESLCERERVFECVREKDSV